MLRPLGFDSAERFGLGGAEEGLLLYDRDAQLVELSQGLRVAAGGDDGLLVGFLLPAYEGQVACLELF